MKTKFTLPVDDDGNLELSKEFLETTGWTGDTKVQIDRNDDGTVTIYEVEDTVESVSAEDDD